MPLWDHSVLEARAFQVDTQRMQAFAVFLLPPSELVWTRESQCSEPQFLYLLHEELDSSVPAGTFYILSPLTQNLKTPSPMSSRCGITHDLLSASSPSTVHGTHSSTVTVYFLGFVLQLLVISRYLL